MPEIKQGDRVTPIGWALPSPKPVGEVAKVWNGPSGRLAAVVWDDGRKQRLSTSVIERVREMPETENPTLWIVTISWPGDAERGMETYGPFSSQQEQVAWVDACQEAAAAGWSLLEGAHYLLHRVIKPFDVDALWELDGGSARNYGDPQVGDVVECQGSKYMVRQLKWVDDVLTEARLAAGRTDSGFWVKTEHVKVTYRLDKEEVAAMRADSEDAMKADVGWEPKSQVEYLERDDGSKMPVGKHLPPRGDRP
jgi:hypothetical protein